MPLSPTTGGPRDGLRAVDLVVGTGGVGTGTVVRLLGDHTLGREESRAVRLLDQQDRCKLHIIAHYVRRLSEPGVRVLAVGRIGDDANGRLVEAELAAEGVELQFLSVDHAHRTLTSICFTYPDGDGGNLTFTDSASDAVEPEDLQGVVDLLREAGDRAIVLAVPEVPFETRMALLRLGSESGATRFASFLSGEMARVLSEGILADLDVLAINLDEARALAEGGGASPGDGTEAIVTAAAECLVEAAPHLQFCITAGHRGSWVWNGRALHFQPTHPVTARNTAGAGDAHLAGLIVGTAGGLDLVDSNRLAGAVSACSVLSDDTINSAINVASVAELIAATDPDLATWLLNGSAG